MSAAAALTGGRRRIAINSRMVKAEGRGRVHALQTAWEPRSRVRPQGRVWVRRETAVPGPKLATR